MAGGVSHCTLLLSREGQRERERGEETDDRRLRGPVTHRVQWREKRRDKKRIENKKEGDKGRARQSETERDRKRPAFSSQLVTGWSGRESEV